MFCRSRCVCEIQCCVANGYNLRKCFRLRFWTFMLSMCVACWMSPHCVGEKIKAALKLKKRNISVARSKFWGDIDVRERKNRLPDGPQVLHDHTGVYMWHFCVFALIIMLVAGNTITLFIRNQPAVATVYSFL
eukprot:GEMP01112929.1.p1 GENE.GEMP01112929.1~~GEMP01112929.1.p1  ORF type:complete len:133 (+),score=3.40 GEMP01112929.1:138-536(+)